MTKKKMTIYKNNGWSLHQNSRKILIFIASKEVGLTLDI